MRFSPFFLACLLGGVLGSVPVSVNALEATEMFENPEREARAREIGRQLRCLVCQNQSIFDSNAGLAYDLRVLVRERMDAGDSDDEIYAYVTERYGDYVLLTPRMTAQNAALWAAPLVLLLGGTLGLTAYYRRGRGTSDISEAELEDARRLLKGESR